MKQYFVDGFPVKEWTDIIKIAKGYGYTGERGLFYTSSAAKYLRANGHTVDEREIAEPKFKIDDTYAYCENHPTTRYDYTKFAHCFHCHTADKPNEEGGETKKA